MSKSRIRLTDPDIAVAVRNIEARKRKIRRSQAPDIGWHIAQAQARWLERRRAEQHTRNG